MPIYKFECSNEDCGHTEEKIVKAGTKEIECSTCGSVSEKNFLGSMLFSSTGLPNGHISIQGRPSRKK